MSVHNTSRQSPLPEVAIQALIKRQSWIAARGKFQWGNRAAEEMRRPSTMPNSSSEILVELNTPRRGFFKGYAKTVELRADTGVIAMNAGEANYLSLTGTTEITLRVDRTILCFVVKNATASQQD